MSGALRAGALVSLADAERPNQYPASRKLAWLRELDGLLYEELLRPHELEAEPPAERYGEDTPLLVGFPYGEQLYRAWLFTQIELSNGEILRYNQALSLFQWLWQLYADSLNRRARPRGASGWRA